LALEEADRLKRLLGEILQYSREQTLQTDELELNALVGEIRERVMEFPEIQPDRLEVISTVPEVRIQGDRDKLIQVFVNLIRNAGEAVENDEPITWRIDRDRHPCQVCASVRNGGSPIPAEILAKIGTPFVTTKPEGNGLGLAIVKRIVEAHGARLDIESDAKRGTTVRVIFPTLERMLS
jgi:signal transduction histidine kinase